MNKLLMTQLYANLDVLIKNGALSNKFIILFGANKTADLTCSYLGSRSISVNAIIDNNPEKRGETLRGVTIYAPDELFRHFSGNAIVLIASKYYAEMKRTVMKFGIEDSRIVRTLCFAEHSAAPETFAGSSDIVMAGFDVYKRIKKDRGDDVFIILNPYPSMGDSFIIFTYLEEYVRQNRIVNYVAAVTGGASVKIAEVFGKIPYVNITQEENDALAAFSTFMAAPDVKVVSFAIPYTSLLAGFYAGGRLNWGEMIREAVLGLGTDAKKALPEKKVMQNKSFFEENNLQKGKTVILAPFAVTAPSLPDTFWNALVEALINIGYIVRLNIAENESANIDGAEPLFIPLEEMMAFIEDAGVFISLRSGLCDLLSGAYAKKIIIYPDKEFFDFFGVNNIGLSETCDEIIYENDDKTVESVMEQLLDYSKRFS